MRRTSWNQYQYAKKNYERINKKTFLMIALFSLFLFFVCIGYTVYKNYSIYSSNHPEFEYDFTMLLPYPSLLYSIVLSVLFFIIFSLILLAAKRFFMNKLPPNYFIEKEAEEKSNESIQKRIRALTIRKKNKLSFIALGLSFALFVFFILFLIYILGEKNFSFLEMGIGISISLLSGTIFGFWLYFKNSFTLENLQWKVFIDFESKDQNNSETDNEAYLEDAINSFSQKEINNEFLEKFFQSNHKYLIAYNDLTKKQADKSFSLALFSSIAGAILIGSSIILMLAHQIDASYVVTAGGVITEILSTVFLYFHYNTLKNMGKFHHKLLLSQNISIALKIAETLPPGDKISTQTIIAEQLVNEINKYISYEKD